MKKILILVIALFVSGCVTEKKRMQICQTCPEKIIRNDSTGTKIVIKDSIIYTAAPRDTIKVHDSVNCEKPINLPKRTFKSGDLYACVWIVNNNLFVDMWTTGKPIPVIVAQSNIKETKEKTTKEEKRLPPVIVYKIPWYIYLIISLLIFTTLFFLGKWFF